MDSHVPSRLRYVDADQLDRKVLDLDGLDVRNTADDHIGDVEGLLVDSVSGRPRYLVVDSGGWFRSRRFLLPVMHARLDSDRRALRVDFDRDTINRFPEMREERFDALTDDELERYDQGVMRASASDLRGTGPESVRAIDYDAAPTWWNSQAWAALPVAGATGAAMGRSRTSDVAARSREEISGRLREEDDVYLVRDEPVVARDRDAVRRDDLRAPAVGERAQPGDILGIESGGERTSIGDTAENEDRRREQAEKAVRDMKDDE
jgi:PRC-barrel domain